VFGGDPRIVEAEGARVDFAPRGHLVVTRHRDQPGVIGLIGSLLGKAEANIRRVELAPPHGKEELAAAFLALYEEPAPELVAVIRELEMVESVHHLSL
jgi:D-3-phosphoglycerate dehydrogenase